jgi:cell division protein FtsL
MTQTTDTDIRDIKTSIEANTKSIGDLTTSVASLREEMRLGFAHVETKFAEVNGEIKELRSDLKGEIKELRSELKGEIKELRSELKGLDTKFDERTKLGFWGFILRGSVLTAIVGIGGLMLSIVAEYVHKIPSL